MVKKNEYLMKQKKMEQLEKIVEKKEDLETNANGEVEEEDDVTKEEQKGDEEMEKV